MSRTITATEEGGLNVVVLVGEVTSTPDTRDLADGSSVTTFDLATRTDVGRMSVPISMMGEVTTAETGGLVLVVGHVRRRFFRSASGVTSRTEVVATVVTPLRRRAQVRRVLDAACEELTALIDA